VDIVAERFDAGLRLGEQVVRDMVAVQVGGRHTSRLSKSLGASGDLLTVKLDVTRLDNAQQAMRAAVDRFGRIDVLVNNAASFHAGYFEELSPEQFEQQPATSLTGPMNVTRAVLRSCASSGPDTSSRSPRPQA
jgi:NAD(P)-dependent dehydrogenase (short-subunit alcohol dehydrogenase family)